MLCGNAVGHPQETLAIFLEMQNNLNTNCSHLHDRLNMATLEQHEPKANVSPASRNAAATEQSVTRINSRDLFRQMREIEIAHEGRIYHLRLTQLNKLILTA